ncbi:MAG: hypothetical protein Q9188_006709 [Gyalolechia gomerana]
MPATRYVSSVVCRKLAVRTKVYFPAFALKIFAELYASADEAPDRKGAAIVVSHLVTGVKEQTSVNYAVFSLKQASTPLPSTQGTRVKVRASLEVSKILISGLTVTYLTMLKGKVDPQRSGVPGICASGGDTSYATKFDISMKSLRVIFYSNVPSRDKT